jgi:putative redox protein
METVRTVYSGGLRTSALHIRSGNRIITDAPVDNQGRGEAFSPTDLVATALGSCMLTIMGIAANTSNFSIDGTEIGITKIMSEKPRRIGQIRVEFIFPPNNYSDRDKMILERAAKQCPVALSLHPDVVQEIVFNFKS